MLLATEIFVQSNKYFSYWKDFSQNEVLQANESLAGSKFFAMRRESYKKKGHLIKSKLSFRLPKNFQEFRQDRLFCRLIVIVSTATRPGCGSM